MFDRISRGWGIAKASWAVLDLGIAIDGHRKMEIRGKRGLEIVEPCERGAELLLERAPRNRCGLYQDMKSIGEPGVDI